jgi:hypothetical protein
MPISIHDFKAWAGQNQGTAAAKSNGPAQSLVSASTQIGFFDHIFRRGKINDVRKAVMADFTHALSARYGDSIAQQAISHAGLSSTSELKGRTISNVIREAQRLRAEMLRPTAAQDLRLGNTRITHAQIGGFGPADQKFVNGFLRRRAVAIELLGEMPITQADYNDFHARLTTLSARLNALLQNIPASIPANEFTTEVNDLVRALTDKAAQAQLLVRNQPLNQHNIDQFKDIWRDAAINVMLSFMTANGANQPVVRVVNSVITQLSTNAQTIHDFNDSVRLSKKAKDDVAAFVAQLLNDKLAQANVRGFRFKASDIASQLPAAYRQTLNERPWATVHKTISTSVSNRPVELKSTIAPAEQLGHSPQAPRGPIAAGYPPLVHGYMCHSADTNHATNLSVSSLTVGNPGGAQQLVFCGVRHGVHCAWQIRNAASRASANVHRAQEAVIAAFLAQYSVPGHPPALPAAGPNGTITVNLPMVSVSLLTPDKARNFFKKGSSSDERSMLIEQTAAWNSVAHTGVTFQFNGQQIRVMPQILTFNFGVNNGAVNHSVVTPNLVGGWDLSDILNNTAFTALQQSATAYLQSHPGLPQAKQDAINDILTQCTTVLAAKGERRDSHDAYKMAARIAVLAQLTEHVPCWNCKSGKDRTGEMDVECKFLSTLIARGERVPAPGAPLTPEQQALFRSIALEGGNFEIQKMNTGIEGFKTDDVASIGERLGGKKYHEIQRGGSAHVNV